MMKHKFSTPHFTIDPALIEAFERSKVLAQEAHDRATDLLEKIEESIMSNTPFKVGSRWKYYNEFVELTTVEYRYVSFKKGLSEGFFFIKYFPIKPDGTVKRLKNEKIVQSVSALERIQGVTK